MVTIHTSDKIFAIVSQRGHIISNFTFSGITSVADIIALIGKQIKGLITITLRNYTQGWQRNHTIMLAN